MPGSPSIRTAPPRPSATSVTSLTRVAISSSVVPAPGAIAAVVIANLAHSVQPLTARERARLEQARHSDQTVMIRSAEEGKQSLRFGKTQALAYDSIREQILVPN